MKPKSAAVGQHVRNHVIPAGMSVTGAAKRLGVGRPALSNLLNGRASLSPKMATRLERAFGADREELLQLQASEDRERVRDEEKAVAVRGYVPNFLTIKARDIERWADSVDARSRLAVLLRKLVHETGRDLTRVDFPGFDESERPGWDGWVEAATATAWIPQGASGWEFGTSKDSRPKAECDYKKRLRLPTAEREQCAFVFVTPRNWSDKGKWAKAKEAQGDGWREVRAYDASDLEQWLDESVAARVWLAEQLPVPVPGVRTLDACWIEWAEATNPPMTEHIFQSSVSACLDSFKDWLEKPPQRPFVVAADSNEEALAFLHCLFRHKDVPEHNDRAAVFEFAHTLATLAASSAPLIAIAANVDTQRGLAPLQQRMHCIAMCPRNAVNVKPDFALTLLDAKAFHEGLAGMGFDPHDFDRLTRESGRSPTVLRRRRATIPSLKTPPWATDTTLLAPMCLLGAWHVHSKADRHIVATLANCEHEAIEKHVTQLLQIEDSPVWSVGAHHGVTSKIDTLFAVAPRMTEADVRNFLTVAADVLSEADPRLELHETDQWAAAVHGKVRSHSDALRNGILETLVLLSVHGNHLFQGRLGVDAEVMISALVARLLTPLAEKLRSQERDLPSYAEAAPERFLSILEDDLNGSNPVVLRLLKPVGFAPFEHSQRTGLLWAIECLAWSPNYLARACVLLAKLSRVEIGDNYFNRPTESLASVLRSWMPQTAASLEERLKILKMLARRFPDVGWQLCLGEIEGMRLVMSNYRPRWRSYAEDADGVASPQEAYALMQCAVSLLLSREEYDQSTLGDLVRNIRVFTEELQLKIWDLIDAWAAHANEGDAASLREQIRRRTLTKVGQGCSRTVADRALRTYGKLEPRTLILRHAWLFASPWIQESADEIEGHETDYKARHRRIEDLRRTAMDEIWAAHGLDGVTRMIERGNDPHTVGRHAARCITDPVSVLRTCLVSELDVFRIDKFMCAIVAECADPAESDLLLDLSKQIGKTESVRLWTCAPFNEKTWRMLDRLPSEVKVGYWRAVSPPNWLRPDEKHSEAIEGLLAVERPHAAFSVVSYCLESVETGLLMRLLRALGSADKDTELGVLPVEPWDISEALEILDTRPGVTVQDKARLEFAFIDALRDSKHGIPNLERLIETSPAFFADIISHCFKRKDGKQDPAERQVVDERIGRDIALGAFQLLHQVARVPGTGDDGTVDRDSLLRWLNETRQLCAQSGRTASGDRQIGELLARAPEGDDGIWPCKPVCEALEAVGTEDIERGFIIGKRNMRGMFMRTGEGGEMERELAAQYRRWAQHRRADYPFAGRVLTGIAESYDEYARYRDGKADLSRRLNTWD